MIIDQHTLDALTAGPYVSEENVKYILETIKEGLAN